MSTWCVLEGVDGAGKSTLAQEIHRLTDAKVSPLGPPSDPTSALTDCVIGKYGVVSAYRTAGTYSLISDRLHWGSPVYGPVFRPQHNADGWGDLGVGGWRYVELLCISRGAMVVYVDVDADVARKRVLQRGDDYVSADQIAPLVKRYRDVAKQSAALSMMIRLSSPGDTHLAAMEIHKRAMELSERAHFLNRYPTYVGSLTPRVIVNDDDNIDVRCAVLSHLGPYEWMRVGFMCDNPYSIAKSLNQSFLTDPLVVSSRPMRQKDLPRAIADRIKEHLR
jgi:hypothetical protein